MDLERPVPLNVTKMVIDYKSGEIHVHVSRGIRADQQSATLREVHRLTRPWAGWRIAGEVERRRVHLISTNPLKSYRVQFVHQGWTTVNGDTKQIEITKPNGCEFRQVLTGGLFNRVKCYRPESAIWRQMFFG